MNSQLVERGDAALAKNIAARHSGNTQRAYAQAFRQFQEFAGPAMPADPKTVATYLSLIGETTTPSNVRVHAAAIAAEHELRGMTSPVAHKGVRVALSGHANRVRHRPTQASPIDSAAWERITETAMQPRITRGGRMETQEQANRRALVDTCLIGLMRDALLRRSEAAELRWEHLAVQSDETSRLLIPHSKTDQQGEGVIRFVSKDITEHLMALKIVTEGGLQDSMFGLSDSQICRRIAKAAEQAGLKGKFSGHSPRIGMAIDLSRSGVSLADLMEAGRWQSEKMPAHYVSAVEAGKGAVARWYGQD